MSQWSSRREVVGQTRRYTIVTTHCHQDMKTGNNKIVGMPTLIDESRVALECATFTIEISIHRPSLHNRIALLFFWWFTSVMTCPVNSVVFANEARPKF